MTRVAGATCGAEAVALAGLATTWRVDDVGAGAATTIGFSGVPVVGLVLFGLGVVALVVGTWRAQAALPAASLCFAVAAVVGLAGGLDTDDSQTVGPAAWLFFGGCLAAAILAAVTSRLVTPPPASFAVDNAEARVRQALAID